MKRDMNLVRDILLWAVEQESAGIYKNPSFHDYSDDQVAHHIYLMDQAGLVEAADATTQGSDGPIAILLNVTWAGHDFIDAARDPSLWEKAMSKIRSSGGAITFDLLKNLLGSLAMHQLGIS